MNNGWFIPVSLVCFVAVVVSLWMYVTQTDEAPLPETPAHKQAAVSHPPHAAADRERRGPAEATRRAARDAAEPGPAERSRRPGRSLLSEARRRWAAVRRTARLLLGTLDQAAVRLRSNVGRTATARLMAARYDLWTGRPAAALRRFDDLLDRHPADTAALAGRAEALIALNRHSEAADTYQRLILLDPDDARARYNYGVLLMRLGEWGAASEAFCEVVRLAPDHARAHYNLAALAQREGRLAEARDEWTAFTRLRPDDPEGWFQLGIAQLAFDRPLEAALAFSNVLLIDPDDPVAHLNLGLAYARAGDLASALEAVEQADALAPCDPHILGTLADLHRNMAALNPGLEVEHLATAALLEEQAETLADEARPAAERLAGGPEAEEME